MKYLMLVTSFAFFLQAPEGKEAKCDNYKESTHKCECAKAMTECSMPGMGAQPDNKCFTFCRPDKCSCAGKSCRS